MSKDFKPVSFAPNYEVNLCGVVRRVDTKEIVPTYVWVSDESDFVCIEDLITDAFINTKTVDIKKPVDVLDSHFKLCYYNQGDAVDENAR